MVLRHSDQVTRMQCASVTKKRAVKARVNVRLSGHSHKALQRNSNQRTSGEAKPSMALSSPCILTSTIPMDKKPLTRTMGGRKTATRLQSYRHRKLEADRATPGLRNFGLVQDPPDLGVDADKYHRSWQSAEFHDGPSLDGCERQHADQCTVAPELWKSL